MRTILVKIGSRYYQARINPKSRTTRDEEHYARLCGAYKRQHKKGRLASMIRLAIKMRKLETKLRNNPLISSKRTSSVSKNIRYLLKHPRELTAKSKLMKRKQAIAIALSVWRKARA